MILKQQIVSIMVNTSFQSEALSKAILFIKSGGIRRSLVVLLRILQLAWAFPITILLFIVLLQLFLGAFGYHPFIYVQKQSNIVSILIGAIFLSYPASFALRAIMLELAPEYMDTSDNLDHLRAMRLLCILLAIFSNNKPISQAVLAICAVDLEYKIGKAQRKPKPRSRR